jgi:competence protein ComEC
LGIVFSNHFQPNPTGTFFSIGFFFSLFLLTFYLSKRHFIQKSYFGIVTCFLFFQIGCCTQVIHNEFYNKDNYVHLISNETNSHVSTKKKEKMKNKRTDRLIKTTKITRFDNRR